MPLLKRSLSSLETWNHLCPSLRRWLPLSSLECLRWNSKHLYLTALLEILYPIWSNVELHMRLMYCKQREKAVFSYVIRFGSLDKRIQMIYLQKKRLRPTAALLNDHFSSAFVADERNREAIAMKYLVVGTQVYLSTTIFFSSCIYRKFSLFI